MANVPPDFGGFLGYWFEGKAVLSRYGRGKPVEGVVMTPLNLLQARKIIDDLIDQGMESGKLTNEHFLQSEQLEVARGLENIMPRDQVDEIAGPD